MGARIVQRTQGVNLLGKSRFYRVDVYIGLTKSLMDTSNCEPLGLLEGKSGRFR
jgi:hypothetical protein